MVFRFVSIVKVAQTIGRVHVVLMDDREGHVATFARPCSDSLARRRGYPVTALDSLRLRARERDTA
jgi:hypothetical protein